MAGDLRKNLPFVSLIFNVPYDDSCEGKINPTAGEFNPSDQETSPDDMESDPCD